MFDFSRGIREGLGLQPGSEYVWDYLFKVKNNTTEWLDWEVKVTGELRNYVKVKAGFFADWDILSASVIPLYPGWHSVFNYHYASVKIEIPPTGVSLMDVDGTIVVSASTSP